MSNTDRQTPTLVDIEQHMTGKWVEEQLARLELLVREQGGDDEMLDVIEFLRDENDWWAVTQMEELDRSGRLSLPDESGARH
jgi:hypothetical protein